MCFGDNTRSLAMAAKKSALWVMFEGLKRSNPTYKPLDREKNARLIAEAPIVLE